MQKFSFVSAALLVAATLALMGCGNALHDLHQKDGPQHPAVTFEQATGTLAQRASFNFAAKTSGVYGNRAEDVTWELSVVSGDAPGAKLSSDGTLSLRFRDEPGAVLAVTARSVRRPEVFSTAEVTVEHFFVLEGADDDEDVTVHFTDGRTMTGYTANGGVAFDQEDLPGGDWVMERVEIGTGPSTEVLIGRPSGSVGEHGVHLKLSGSGGSYALEHRPADSGGFIPIGSFAEFQLINTDAGTRSGNYKQEADLDLLGDKDGDGTFSDQKWMRIGDSTNRFTGTFDGDNKGITNLYIDETTNYQGLFGYADADSTISKVNILSGMVTGGSCTAGVLGENYGTIKNCTNGGTVTGNNNVGGVVGQNRGTIKNCTNGGTVTGTSYVGGVVGNGVGSGGLVEKCTNSKSGTVRGYSHVGGVMGSNSSGNGVIENCTNDGTVRGNGSCGGVVGENVGYLSNCTNSGTVTATADYVGGVVGGNVGNTSNCTNSGTIMARNRAGGVIGQSTGSISNCSNSGTVTITGDDAGGVVGRSNGAVVTGCSNSGTITARNQIGGVVGYILIQGTVTGCYNTGAVSGTGDNIGGVVGRNSHTSGATVTACYNTGTVSTNGAGSNIGGIVGYNYQSGAGAVTVTACYNTGAVVAATASNVGGVAGNNNAGTISDCWWLDLSGAGIGSVSTATGTGSATATAFSGGNWPNGSGDWGGPNWGAMGGWNNGNHGRASTFPKLAGLPGQ